MNIEEYREYCLKKNHVEEALPFDESTLVFKLNGKMFALMNIDTFEFINLKHDPEKSLELRERYEGITPAFHMSKKHWNSVKTQGDVSDELIWQLTDESYELVFKSFSKVKQKEMLQTKQ